MVGFLPDDLENYISAHSESGGDIEKELRKETLGLGPSSGMMSGDSVGNFLKFIVKINKCRKILEIGTFTGYSALMLASELPDDGELLTCDINSETSNLLSPAFWLLKPRSIISALEVIPDFPAFRLCNTSVALFPIDETIPNPVITTRRIVYSFLG